MSKSNRHAGQHDLKGRKTKLLKCKCCVIVDMRDKLIRKDLRKEIKEDQSEGFSDIAWKAIGT